MVVREEKGTQKMKEKEGKGDAIHLLSAPASISISSSH
jgi:hypothetical protein